MYQRQSYSFPGIPNAHNGIRPNIKDKENIPVNPQALYRTHNISANSDALKDISSLNMHSYHIPHPLKQREKRDNSIQGRLRECTSAGVSRRKTSFDIKPKDGESRQVDVSLLEIDKDGAITQREVREEKEILINEFKSIGEKLKKMRDLDRKSHTRGNSLSHTDRYLEENHRRSDLHDKENGQAFHTEILCKLDELNHKYQKLAKNITNYPPPQIEERTSYNTRSTLKDTESARSHRFDDMNHIKMMKNTEYRTYRNETKRTFPEVSTEGDIDLAREEFEREKAEFFRRKMESEAELKAQHQEFEVKKRHLLDLEVELTKREAEIDERTRILELNEKEFEQLTERLEKQSEELTNQKMEYNKKVETFHTRVEAFEREKEEFGKIENEFSLKNIELRSDQEQLKAYQDKLRVEHELLEERCRNLMNEYDEFNKRKRMLDEREEDVKLTEDDLEGKVEKYNEDIEALNIERQEFIKLVDIAEKRLKEREEELAGRETSLDLRKEKYDEFDLKLLGMRLNEEVWQKKRDIEVGALQVEIHKIKEKEKELRKREEKLKKIEGGFDRLENGERSTMGTRTEGSGNDKSLMPMSSRTFKTETEGRETMENIH